MLWLLNLPHSSSLEWKTSPELFTAPVWWHLYGAENLLGGTAVFTFLMEMSERKHTHTHTHTVHREVSVHCRQLLCVCVCVCVCEPPMSCFLSLICHTYCTVIVLLSAFIPAGIYVVLPTWHTMCAIVCWEGVNRVSVCICVSVTMSSVSVQIVVTLQLVWIFSALSQLSEWLPSIFTTPIFYRNHCFKLL